MLDGLSISGATLASLLQSCYIAQRPCVGLLFGGLAGIALALGREVINAIRNDKMRVTCAACCVAHGVWLLLLYQVDIYHGCGGNVDVFIYYLDPYYYMDLLYASGFSIY
jgi:ABC-type uncharacterized transport system permease subunit